MDSNGFREINEKERRQKTEDGRRKSDEESYQFPVARCQLPDASYQLPVARCQLPVASCQMPVASFLIKRSIYV